jgi:transcriptional regulator with GAF, ATPase, and Fis domain
VASKATFSSWGVARNSSCKSPVENNEPDVGSSDQIGAKMAARQWRVILWDQQPYRRARVRQLVEAFGARAIEILDLQRAVFSSACCVAAVGIGSEPDGAGMCAIRDLKRQGFEILAYEDGSECWSVKLKCLSLLAGAGQLLDSGDTHFGCRFQSALTQIHNAEAKKQEEDQKTALVMCSMGMVGSSAAMMSVFRSVIRFSTLSDLPVLIGGETGTGKEGLARALHRLDPKRRGGPFVAVNCGAIAAPLAESEFFGHRRGAFTGADRDRKGLIRSAEGGVLFLDEIGELDAPLQAKLLRVLQESRVLGVGEDRDIKVDVRVVAATNRDLDQMGQQSRFRADLFHRLNVLSIKVPPLRERVDDLAPLTEHFLEKYRSLCCGGLPEVGIDFLDALRQVSLPGNVRQLENLIRQALVRRRTEAPLGLWDLPVEAWQQLSQGPDASQAPQRERARSGELDPQVIANYVRILLDANGWNLCRSLAHCEREAVEAAMQRANGNQSESARLLGITPRSVYNKMRKYRTGSKRDEFF